MTHPLSRHWTQPPREEILIDETYAVMTAATFQQLHEYSMSEPSGVYEGKMWKAHNWMEGHWWLRWFGVSIHGPAAGQVLMIRRAPVLLRVVRNPLARSGDGQWDALDQVSDEPKPHEEIIVYVRVGEPTRVHIRMSPRSASGFYPQGYYKVLPTQPDAAEVRSNAVWQRWCLRWQAAARQRYELKAGGGA